LDSLLSVHDIADTVKEGKPVKITVDGRKSSGYSYIKTGDINWLDINTDWSNEPRTIGEKRDGGWDTWHPRDVLVNLLREIDSGGSSPETLVIITIDPSDDGEESLIDVTVASPHKFMYVMGAIESSKSHLFKSRDVDDTE
jgi:hypothetical protein